MSIPFLNIYSKNVKKSYSDLLSDINSISKIHKYVYSKDVYFIYLSILASALNKSEIILLDGELTFHELSKLGISQNELKKSSIANYSNVKSLDELLERIDNHECKISLFTSGTTGKPKSIVHKMDTFLRSVRRSGKFMGNKWGLCYHPSHFAGLSVFFQALLNLNSLTYLFDLDKNKITKAIINNEITHLSATPSFYRKLLPNENKFANVKSITFGGERFESNLVIRMSEIFPNARFRNIYASTEAGALFISKNDVFTVLPKFKNLIKFNEDRLLIHKSILGKFTDKIFDGKWYDSGDIIEIIDNDPPKFKFISRQSDFVNVGGFKVNPLEVEELIKNISAVKYVRVYGKKNSVLGNILVAEIQPFSNSLINEQKIREYLIDKVQGYKMPRIINFVEKIKITKTGKIKR